MILFLSLSAAGCTQNASSASYVNRPGTWSVSFEKLVDVDGPPYVVTQPAPEYPDRTMSVHQQAVDRSGCSAGCDCQFVNAREQCTGDVAESCHAWGGFLETCVNAKTILDCSQIRFDSDQHTTGVCVLEDSSKMSEIGGYQQLGRYQITLDRKSYQ
jgi:hypothetical protein